MNDCDFETFWARYPRKVGKGAARKVWAKLRPSPALVQQMLDTLDWQRDQWTDVRYVPHPTTWLNQERWADEKPGPAPQLTSKHERTRNALQRFIDAADD